MKLTHDELIAARNVTEYELTQLTKEFIRKNQGAKARVNAPIIDGLLRSLQYYDKCLRDLNPVTTPMPKPRGRPRKGGLNE